MTNHKKPLTTCFLVTAAILLLIFVSLGTAVRPLAGGRQYHRALQGPARTAGFHRQPHQTCLAARDLA